MTCHMVEADTDKAKAELDALSPDVEENQRQDLAERYAPMLAKTLKDYPWLRDPKGHVTKSAGVTHATMIESVQELYNPAQRDVITRASIIADSLLRAAEPPTPDQKPTT
ncbi:hypothetical protein [Arthrobacter sp. MSA 4-2]|uniref:hypothetical protein n=1 Tax=Arthrobacter sp. MSA 4-2 TaxID=2794349 RepID=UPI001E58566E|nr:hypothetical protein [Arthrobacter sp. MSA 4-2]